MTGSVLVSAATGFGLDTLRAEIAALLASLWEDVDVAVPYAAGELLARVRERGTVDLEYRDRDVRVTGRMAPGLAGELRSAVRALGGVPRRRGRGLLSDADGRRVRPASRLGPDGDRATGSGGPSPKGGAAGAGARRSSARAALRHSLLLETAADGAFSHLELSTPAGLLTLHPEGDGTLHGNAIEAGGIRHVVGLPWDGRRPVLDIEGAGDRRRACARLLAPDRIGPGASGSTRPCSRVTAALLITTGPALVERIARRRRGGSPAASRSGRTTTGLPLLADAEAWPLEQSESATDSR